MSERFNEWAILELMGHRRLAGRAEDVEVFGGRMCRIDIPSDPPVTQFFGPASIYSMTPTTEEVCRAFAKQQGAPPALNRWDLRALEEPQRALPSDTTRGTGPRDVDPYDFGDDDGPDGEDNDDQPEAF